LTADITEVLALGNGKGPEASLRKARDESF